MRKARGNWWFSYAVGAVFGLYVLGGGEKGFFFLFDRWRRGRRGRRYLGVKLLALLLHAAFASLGFVLKGILLWGFCTVIRFRAGGL